MCFADQLQPSRLESLPPRLYENTRTEYFSQAAAIHINRRLLTQLGLARQPFLNDECLPHMQAISTVYAGHQFGIYTSKLGDGRVHILGDVPAGDGTCWEVQLKGAGATPFARGNSGRMSLAEAITEYLGCEAMAGLDIATTRGLALIQDSGQTDECVIVRTAPSHLRFGHFEYLHNQQDLDLLKQLTDHVIEQFYPELSDLPDSRRYLQFLYAVTQRTARLLAKWQAVGFVHSVMNTDNMSILGLTLDYGVYGFMPEFEPTYSPNPNDDQQRYAFDQQVEVARWNCLALAEALQELLPDKQIPATLLRFYRQVYRESWSGLMHSKLGLTSLRAEDDGLMADLLNRLLRCHFDYTRFFRQLAYLPRCGEEPLLEEQPESVAIIRPWLEAYRQRLQQEPSSSQEQEYLMLATNPKYILRQTSLQTVLERAEQAQDFSPLCELLRVLQSPFDEHSAYEYLA